MIDDSTLRRRIRQLEQQLGRTLIRPQRHRLAGKPADLHALVDAAQRMEEAARCFSRDPQAGAGVSHSREHVDGRVRPAFWPSVSRTARKIPTVRCLPSRQNPVS